MPEQEDIKKESFHAGFVGIDLPQGGDMDEYNLGAACAQVMLEEGRQDSTVIDLEPNARNADRFLTRHWSVALAAGLALIAISLSVFNLLRSPKVTMHSEFIAMVELAGGHRNSRLSLDFSVARGDSPVVDATRLHRSEFGEGLRNAIDTVRESGLTLSIPKLETDILQTNMEVNADVSRRLGEWSILTIASCTLPPDSPIPASWWDDQKSRLNLLESTILETDMSMMKLCAERDCLCDRADSWISVYLNR